MIRLCDHRGGGSGAGSVSMSSVSELLPCTDFYVLNTKFRKEQEVMETFSMNTPGAEVSPCSKRQR